MNWICPRCHEELGELNGRCEYCIYTDNTIIYSPYIRDIKIRHTREEIMLNDDILKMSQEEYDNMIDSNERMTPREKLYSKLFFHDTKLVMNMDILTLRAHREECADIAFRARVGYDAATDVEKTREKQSKPKGPTGFTRSVNTDETTTAAINTIKERQKKLSGKEKMLSNLIDLYVKGGMSRSEAEKVASTAMGAGSILERLKDKETTKEALTGDKLRSPLSQENGFTFTPSKPEETKKPLFNPFERKVE